MLDPELFRENWKNLQDDLRRRWEQLTANDLQAFDGSVDQLIELIQQKTGDAREAIERYLDELVSSTASALEHSRESLESCADHAEENLQQGSRQIAEGIRKACRSAEEFVRRRPAEAVAVCFGAGLVIGLLFGSRARRDRDPKE